MRTDHAGLVGAAGNALPQQGRMRQDPQHGMFSADGNNASVKWQDLLRGNTGHYVMVKQQAALADGGMPSALPFTRDQARLPTAGAFRRWGPAAPIGYV